MTANLLRRAADLLDKRSAGALRHERWDCDVLDEDGPWVVHLDTPPETWPNNDDEVPTVATLGRDCDDGDRAAWIALTHPGIAQPLADWLRGTAIEIDDGLHPIHIGCAAAVARALLGENE